MKRFERITGIVSAVPRCNRRTTPALACALGLSWLFAACGPSTAAIPASIGPTATIVAAKTQLAEETLRPIRFSVEPTEQMVHQGRTVRWTFHLMNAGARPINGVRIYANGAWTKVFDQLVEPSGSVNNGWPLSSTITSDLVIAPGSQVDLRVSGVAAFEVLTEGHEFVFAPTVTGDGKQFVGQGDQKRVKVLVLPGVIPTAVPRPAPTPDLTPLRTAFPLPIDSGPTPVASFPMLILVGKSQTFAEGVVRQMGATPKIVTAKNAAPAGTVFKSDPSAGEPMPHDGATVTLWVSTGP